MGKGGGGYYRRQGWWSGMPKAALLDWEKREEGVLLIGNHKAKFGDVS